MSAKRNAIIIAGMAVFAGNIVVQNLFVGARAVGFLNSPEEGRELRAGFEEVSDDWNSWATIWADSTGYAFRMWGASLSPFHLTEDEVIGLYRFRASLFGQMATDSASSPFFCSGGWSSDEEWPESVKPVDLASMMRTSGRVFGRYHEGRHPWVPPVDLETDEAIWVAFAEYLDGIDRGQLFYGLLDMAASIQPDPARDCRFLSELYLLASERAQDRVGAIRLIDLVRSMDALAVEQLVGWEAP